MPISEYFARSYSEARTKFLAAAHAAKAALTHYALTNYHGPENEGLVIDVALLGSKNPESLLVLISGTHGVEGFCGSGCQVGYLTDQLYEALSPTSALVLLHALNPFGFAWLRRVNEDNVDFNRNFHDFSRPLPSSESYEALHDCLIPQEWEGEKRKSADMALQDYITKKGFRTVQAEMTAGQYTRPNGLFFGGHKATWSNRILRRVLTERLTPTVKKVAIIDFHTGLGKAGFGEAIYVSSTNDDVEISKKLVWRGNQKPTSGYGGSYGPDGIRRRCSSSLDAQSSCDLPSA
jgi:hypothetical protein